MPRIPEQTAPASRSSQFSRIGPYTGAGTGAGPSLIKPLPQAQTGEIDPRGVVATNLRQLKDDFKQRADSLKASGLDVNVHNRILAGWQDEYDQAKGQLTGVTTQLGLIEQGIASGEMTQEAGREAAIRMIVPRETADLMFPSIRPEPRGRFTPGEFRSYVEAFKDVAKPAIKRPWLARNYADPGELKDQYFTARSQFAYDTDMNVDERRAFDHAWDQAMRGNSKTATAWKKMMNEDPDLFTSRTYDARLLNIAAEKARGTTSPLGKAISKQKRPTAVGNWSPYGGRSQQAAPTAQTGRIRVIAPDGTTGTIEADEWPQHQAQGFKRAQ